MKKKKIVDFDGPSYVCNGGNLSPKKIQLHQ
jgi:hypothetical protein